MPKIDEATKGQRLERLYLILTRNARGLTEAEIADELRLERRTVNNYLRELETQGKAFKDGIYWFPLVLKGSRLRSFDLSRDGRRFLMDHVPQGVLVLPFSASLRLGVRCL